MASSMGTDEANLHRCYAIAKQIEGVGVDSIFRIIPTIDRLSNQSTIGIVVPAIGVVRTWLGVAGLSS